MRYSLIAALILNLTVSQVALSDELTHEDSGFLDVPENHMYAEAIYALNEAGIVDGYSDGTFGVDKIVNRAEALKMIFKGSDTEVDENLEEDYGFPDLVMNQWYMPYVHTGLELNIVNGHDDGYFRPGSPVNRVEALKMLVNTRGVEVSAELSEEDEWFIPFLNFGEENALVVPNAEGEYEADAALTRGELAEMIYRLDQSKFTGQTEYGIASYYADKFNGRGTASGEVFDNSQLTAAHISLPFGTMLRVTNLANGLSVDVRVNDRGPYGPGRVVDLSTAAFESIGSLGSGLLNVRVEVLQ